jgi:hypothetical protein
MSKRLVERNKLILDEISCGRSTFTALALRFGISRPRIKEIYERENRCRRRTIERNLLVIEQGLHGLRKLC